MSAEWHPEQYELELGADEYVRYLTGVALLNTPFAPQVHSLLGMGREDGESIVAHGDDLMYGGLRGVIRFAHGNTNERMVGLVKLEHHFKEAFPPMRKIVNLACRSQVEYINSLNPNFSSVRRPPIFNPTFYDHLCHARREYLSTVVLMGDFLPAAMLVPYLHTRSYSSASNGDAKAEIESESETES
jgi:hypothetical protein